MRYTRPNLVFVFLALSSTAALGGFDEGAADYRAGNYQGAFNEWSVAAQQGDVDAQYNLGCLYLRGEGVAPNRASAADWLQRAADQGDIDAATWLLFSKPITEERRKQFFSKRLTPTDRFRLTFAVTLSNGRLHRRPCATDRTDGAEIEFSLGLFYEKGLSGFPQDDAQAAEWYRRAAKRNYAEAQTHLAYLYGAGRGVPQNQVEAARLFRLAAEEGEGIAQVNLAGFYANGSFGYNKDLTLAYVLVSHVADLGNQLAIDNLPKVRALLSPDQLQESERLAEKWKGSGPWPDEIAQRIGPPR